MEAQEARIAALEAGEEEEEEDDFGLGGDDEGDGEEGEGEEGEGEEGEGEEEEEAEEKESLVPTFEEPEFKTDTIIESMGGESNYFNQAETLR